MGRHYVQQKMCSDVGNNMADRKEVNVAMYGKFAGELECIAESLNLVPRNNLYKVRLWTDFERLRQDWYNEVRSGDYQIGLINFQSFDNPGERYSAVKAMLVKVERVAIFPEFDYAKEARVVVGNFGKVDQNRIKIIGDLTLREQLKSFDSWVARLPQKKNLI